MGASARSPPPNQTSSASDSSLHWVI